MQYRAEIDGLRAVAVLPVILFHAGFEIFGGGFVGVDVFFVISGYLITSIIWSDMKEGTFSLTGFYERRARRILPALFFIMAVCIPFAWMLLFPRDLLEFTNSLVAVSTFWSNFFFWRESGYFATSAELKPLLHTWSLAVEEQYYIFFPLFLLLVARLGKERILLILSLVGVVSLGMANVAAYTLADAAFFLPQHRVWEIIMGALVALSLDGKHENRLAMPTNQGLSLLGAILIAYSVFWFDESTPVPSLYTLIPTGGAVLIILFAQKDTFVNRVLSNKLLVGIGLISYSAYLWHQPIFAYARYYTEFNLSPVTMVALSVAPLPLAYLTWKYVERPFRKRRAIGRRAIALSSVTVTTAFVALGLFAYDANEADIRFLPNPQIVGGEIGHPYFYEYLSDTYYDCQPEIIANEAGFWEGYRRCKQSKTTDRIDVALVGDSHAEHLFPGIADNLPDKNVVYYLKHGAPLVSKPEFQRIFQSVADDSNIRDVILTSYWSKSIDEAENPGQLENELRSTVDFLRRHGKNVVLVGDVPDFQFLPQQCKYTPRFAADARCESEDDVVKDRVEQSMLSRVADAHSSISYVNLRDLLCLGRTCRMQLNGTLLYRDADHLNVLGSKFIGAKLMERISDSGIY